MNTLITTGGRYSVHLIAGLSLVIGLVACGGGGGGGSSSGGITLPTAPVIITQQNALQVAGAAIDAIYGGTSLPTGMLISGPASASSSVATVQTFAKIGQSAAQQILSQGAVPTTVTAATTTTSCAISGTMTLTTTSSTSGTATYNNCVDVAGETLNGTMSLSNITTSPFSADAVFNLTVTTTVPVNNMTTIGDMHLYVDATSASMSGTRLAMRNTNSTLGTLGLLNYTIGFDSTGTFTTLTFTLASTVINGTVDFGMTTTFINSGGLFPSSGVATISGANSTVLKLTILGNESAALGSQVQLELSTDGGINYAAPTYPNWADISSRI